MRKILGIDNPTRDQARQALVKELEDRLIERHGIILPKHYLNHEVLERQEKRAHYCEGCARPFAMNRPKTLYFGQYFCEECVTKWKSGAR